MNIFRGVFSLTAVALLVAGCSTEGPEEVEATETSVSPSMETTGPSPTLSSESSTAEQSNAQGDSIPSDATEITTIKNPRYGDTVAVFKMPSDNIGCWISQTELNCRISSYSHDRPMGGSSTGANNQVNVTGDSATIGMAGDVPAYMPRAFGSDDTIEAQVVPYGSSVYHGPFACRSEQSGLTCWNSETGVGATMNRAGTEFF